MGWRMDVSLKIRESLTEETAQRLDNSKGKAQKRIHLFDDKNIQASDINRYAIAGTVFQSGETPEIKWYEIGRFVIVDLFSAGANSTTACKININSLKKRLNITDKEYDEAIAKNNLPTLIESKLKKCINEDIEHHSKNILKDISLDKSTPANIVSIEKKIKERLEKKVPNYMIDEVLKQLLKTADQDISAFNSFILFFQAINRKTDLFDRLENLCLSMNNEQLPKIKPWFEGLQKKSKDQASQRKELAFQNRMQNLREFTFLEPGHKEADASRRSPARLPKAAGKGQDTDNIYQLHKDDWTVFENTFEPTNTVVVISKNRFPLLHSPVEYEKQYNAAKEKTQGTRTEAKKEKAVKFAVKLLTSKENRSISSKEFDDLFKNTLNSFSIENQIDLFHIIMTVLNTSFPSNHGINVPNGEYFKNVASELVRLIDLSDNSNEIKNKLMAEITYSRDIAGIQCALALSLAGPKEIANIFKMAKLSNLGVLFVNCLPKEKWDSVLDELGRKDSKNLKYSEDAPLVRQKVYHIFNQIYSEMNGDQRNRYLPTFQADPEFVPPTQSSVPLKYQNMIGEHDLSDYREKFRSFDEMPDFPVTPGEYTKLHEAAKEKAQLESLTKKREYLGKIGEKLFQIKAAPILGKQEIKLTPKEEGRFTRRFKEFFKKTLDSTPLSTPEEINKATVALLGYLGQWSDGISIKTDKKAWEMQPRENEEMKLVAGVMKTLVTDFISLIKSTSGHSEELLESLRKNIISNIDAYPRTDVECAFALSLTTDPKEIAHILQKYKSKTAAAFLFTAIVPKEKWKAVLD